jgi:hypothetical protein
MLAGVFWGAQITALRVVLAVLLEAAILGYFWLCWRLLAR